MATAYDVGVRVDVLAEAMSGTAIPAASGARVLSSRIDCRRCEIMMGTVETGAGRFAVSGKPRAAIRAASLYDAQAAPFQITTSGHALPSLERLISRTWSMAPRCPDARPLMFLRDISAPASGIAASTGAALSSHSRASGQQLLRLVSRAASLHLALDDVDRRTEIRQSRADERPTFFGTDVHVVADERAPRFPDPALQWHRFPAIGRHAARAAGGECRPTDGPGPFAVRTIFDGHPRMDNQLILAPAAAS